MKTCDIIIVCLAFYAAGLMIWVALLDGRKHDLKGSNKRLTRKLNDLQEELDAKS